MTLNAIFLQKAGLRLAVILLLSFFSFFPVSAQVIVSGKITDAATGTPLYPVTIIVHDNGNDNIGYTRSDGQYKISATNGAVLTFHYLGFYNKTYTVPSGLTRIMHNVTLSSRNEHLDTLEVRSLSAYQQDSLDRIKAMGHYLSLPEAPIIDENPHPNGGFGLVFHPFSHFSKKEREKRKFHKMFKREEQNAFIFTRYTPALVHKLTGLKSDSLRLFMNKYRPPYPFTRYSSDLEFWSWVKLQYKDWLNGDK